MARGSFECGETGAESDVQKRSLGEGEELVVGLDEDGDEVVPAVLGKEVLWMPAGFCVSVTDSWLFYEDRAFIDGQIF